MVSSRAGLSLRFAVIGVFALVLAVFGAVTMGAGEARAETGLASWYGPGFAGNPTASGETYDPYGYTAAHKTLPLGTELVVNYGGRSVNVVVNDRGPYVGERTLDLSQGAAQYLGLDQAGVDYVDYSVVGSGYADPTYEESTAYSETTYTDSSGASYGSETYASDGSGAQASAETSGGYVVQSGDTLEGIASANGVSVDQLAAANGIADPDFIVTGQEVYF